MSDLLAPIEDANGYEGIRITRGIAAPSLIEDLEGIEAARWLATMMRDSFEQACYGAKVFGPLGTWDGVLAEEMPGYWVKSAEPVSAGRHLFKTDGRHPVGKWFGDVAAWTPKLPAPEILDAVLRRHGIEGSKELMPVMRMLGDDAFGILIAKPKAKSFAVPGVTRDASVMASWTK